jgi:lipopolysaccharide export system permease protein
MNLIDRYIFRLFLRVLGWSLLAFIAIFVLVDLFDHLDNFLDDDASTKAILKYYMYQLPMILDVVLPVSMLLASLFTVGLLSKQNEYTTILGAGVSLRRASRSILIFALIVSGAALVFRESVVPVSNRRQGDVKKYEIEGRVHGDLQGKSNFTYIGQDGRIYVVKRFRPRPPSLEWLSVQTVACSTLVRRVDARRAVWKDEHWELIDGTIREFHGDHETVRAFQREVLDGPVEEPVDFSRRTIEPDQMTYRELTRFANWVGRTGGDPTPYRAALAHKLSFPLINFILVVLGLALGAGRRKTTLWAGFGLTVGLAFVYYLLMNFGLQLGKTGAIPIWVSAWSGNLLYAAGGVILFARANR